MSYIDQGIEALSQSQIGKLLKGDAVRIRHGIDQAIKLCQEHCKKLQRASIKGKGITIRLDPYAIEHNQHLRHAVRHLRGRGTGTDLGHTLGGVAGDVAVACGDRAIRGLQGSGARRMRIPHNIYGRGTGTDLGHVLGGVAGDVAVACGDRAIRGLEGSGAGSINHPFGLPITYTPTPAQLRVLKKQGVKIGGEIKTPYPRCDRLDNILGGNISCPTTFRESQLRGGNMTTLREQYNKDHHIRGGKLANKLKHGQQVLDFMGHNYQGIAHAVRPVSVPILGALTTRAVNTINPMAQVSSLGDSLKHLFGGEVRDRRAGSYQPHNGVEQGGQVKRNRGRPRKNGGALVSAGY